MSGAWRDAFCRLYQVPRPVVPLGRIMHWRAVVDALGVRTGIDEEPAFVPDGYFYRPHTAPPDPAGLADAVAAAGAGGARWVLVPVVRTGPAAEALERRGGTPLPWFVEAEYAVSGGVDDDLRRLLGGARLRELRRVARRADEQFGWQACTGGQLRARPDVLAAFDRLHQHNLDKYGHRRNHFSLAILAGLATSPVGEQLAVFWFGRRADDRPVQAVLGLVRPAAATLELLVQGIDRGAVPGPHNLYAAAVYHIYRWGAARGIGRFNLGRGAERLKLDLGANRFHVLSNHLLPVAGPHRDLGALRAAATAASAAAMARLAQAVAGRGTGHLVSLDTPGATPGAVAG